MLFRERGHPALAGDSPGPGAVIPDVVSDGTEVIGP